MLRIDVPITPEEWDSENEVFIEPKIQTLQLEHSLVSLSKWESKWCKPFYSQNTRTEEETRDYVRCMTITQNVDPDVYIKLTDQNMREVNEYINAPMTATWFNEQKSGKGRNEQITSELIYYWMISLNIPFDCQKWHLNRLLTLIRVCNAKNEPAKKMGRKEQFAQQRALNAARRKKYNTKG